MIAVYGAGYVGLVTAVCLAHLGNRVICADVDNVRIDALQQGISPIHEFGIPDMLEKALKQGILTFTTDCTEAAKLADVHFIATGTPGLPDGSPDLSQVYAVSSSIARHTQQDAIVIVKSTVPPGTGDALEARIRSELATLGKKHRIAVVSNPEFMREGSAVKDYLHPERIIVGGDPEVIRRLNHLTAPLAKTGVPILIMSRRSAELAKYASNAILACKISFMNQISRIAEACGANIDDIREGMAPDPRIGPHFLLAGIGYGGSCFPKDVRALAELARSLGVEPTLLDAVDAVNDAQKSWVMEQLVAHFSGELRGLTIGVWGLAFKPGTDDMREASSIILLNALLDAGVRLRVHDPAAMTNAKNLFRGKRGLEFCETAESVLGAPVDALVIATEWDDYKKYPLETLAATLKKAPLVDGRNCYSLDALKASNIAVCYSVGRPAVLHGKEGEEHAG